MGVTVGSAWTGHIRYGAESAWAKMMDDLQRPDTQREMIYQLWYAIKGANGDGIWETVKRIERRVGELEKSSATRAELRDAIEKAERDDAAQDERGKWSTDMVDRRKGNKIALAAIFASVLVNVVVAVITVLGG